MSPRSVLLLPLILLSLSPTLCCVSHYHSALAFAPNPFHSAVTFSLPHSRLVDVLTPTLFFLSVDIQPADGEELEVDLGGFMLMGGS